MRANLSLVSFLALAALLPCSATQAQSSDPLTIRIGVANYDPLDAKGPAILAGLEFLELDDPDSANRRIIQLHRAPRREEREMLKRDYGLKLTDYVPDHGYIELVSVGTRARLSKLDLVRADEPYRPSFKIRSDFVRNGKLDFQIAGPIRVELRVSLFDDADPATVRAAFGSSVRCDFRPAPKNATPSLRCPVNPGDLEDALRLILGLDEVRAVEQVLPIDQDATSNLAPVVNSFPGLAAALDLGMTGEKQVVAINDWGHVDDKHCWFSEDPPDRIGFASVRKHPTFAAGLVAGPTGFAPAAKLVSVSGALPMSEKLSEASNKDATIHSCSWHEGTGYGSIAHDVDLFTWFNEDQLVIASSGNDKELPGPPATAKNTISVSAVTKAHTIGDGAPGPTIDERRKPDLVAPGCGMSSSKALTECDIETQDSCECSWATAATAAAAALVREYHLGRCGNCTPSGALIKATLLNSATGLPGLDHPDDSQGWGQVALDHTLPRDTRRAVFFDQRNEGGLDTQESWSVPVRIERSSEDLRVTLVWTEPAGGPNVDEPKVNDLDLVVTDPGGRFHRGNNLPDGCPDPLNNVEQVRIAQPENGKWEIRVEATEVHVANPGQGFAVVATGGLAAAEVATPLEVSVLPGSGPDDSDDAAVTPREGANSNAKKGSAKRMDRRWFETRFLAAGGGDTNPLLAPDGSSSDAFARWGFVVSESYTRFRPLTSISELRWDRMFDIGGVAGVGGDQYTDVGSANRLGWSLGLAAEGAPWKIGPMKRYDYNDDGIDDPPRGRDAFRIAGPGKYSFGAQYRYSDLRVGSAPFLRSHRVVPAAAVNWHRTRDCDLTQLVLFGSYDRLQDRSALSDTELRQDGRFLAGGLRFSWTQTPPDDWVCMGGGIFRRPVIYDYWTARVEAQYGRQDTDGTEFNRDVLALSAGTTMPVWRENKVTRLLFDGKLEYDRADYSNTSILAPVVRDDNLWYLDVGLTLLFLRESSPRRGGIPPRQYVDLRLRLGAEHTNRDSNIPAFGFERTAYTLTLDILFGLRREKGSGWDKAHTADTKGPGSTISGGSDPDLPEILTELP